MPDSPQKIALSVDGMHCVNCANGVERYLTGEGASDVSVNFVTSQARFTLADRKDLPKLIDGIKGLGYSVSSEHANHNHQAHRSEIERKFFICLVFTIPLLIPMWIPIHFLHNGWVQLALTIPVFGIGFWHFGRSALGSLKARYANMDVLIVIGITAAFIYSLVGTLLNLGPDFLFYETSATITTIVLLGNLLEERSVRKTSSALHELTALQTATARKIIIDQSGNEHTIEVAFNQIEKGDLLLVTSGDKVPVDGKITEGGGSIDESMVSGESLPRDKGVNDQVTGGTILVSGSFKMRAEQVGSGTVLAQIIQMIEETQSKKPKIQRIGDSVSSIFTPVVLTLAVLTFIGGVLFFGVPASSALLRAIAVLVIACPCAMGLATPTAVMVGIGRAAKQGILFRGGDILEECAGIKRVVFDKTGTLTNGEFSLSEIIPFGVSPAEVKGIIVALSKNSNHPISKSLVRQIPDGESVEIKDPEEIRGMGMRALDDKKRVLELGGARLAKSHAIESNYTLNLVRDGILIAGIEIKDSIRPGAEQMIRSLNDDGIETVLLSGDTAKRCAEISQTLGIRTVFSEKLPGEKLEIISKLSEESPTAFAGDGINDAPALTRATVGISLSGATQVAISSAQVVLLGGNIAKLDEALRISRLTLKIIKQNLFWAFFYNVIAIPAAMSGILTPMVAALAMTFSDIFVILNSLRLKKLRHIEGSASLT